MPGRSLEKTKRGGGEQERKAVVPGICGGRKKQRGSVTDGAGYKEKKGGRTTWIRGGQGGQRKIGKTEEPFGGKGPRKKGWGRWKRGTVRK